MMWDKYKEKSYIRSYEKKLNRMFTEDLGSDAIDLRYDMNECRKKAEDSHDAYIEYMKEELRSDCGLSNKDDTVEMFMNLVPSDYRVIIKKNGEEVYKGYWFLYAYTEMIYDYKVVNFSVYTKDKVIILEV